jgi:hypothetical protein
VLVLLAAAALAYMTLNNQTPQPVPQEALPAIQQALKSIPPGDVSGTEPPGVPRPARSIRSYYLQRGKVTLAIYGTKDLVVDARAALEPMLAQAGWTPVDAATPAPSAGDTSPARLWRAAYFRQGAVLQVAMFHTRDITSIDYTLQAAP